MFQVVWGNQLEKLADQLFSKLYGRDGNWRDPMIPRCIVTNSPAMEAWLRNHFVYDWPDRGGRVLANCDFFQLYPFVNDWLRNLLEPEASGPRRPLEHPYSVPSLQWRIFRLLVDEPAGSPEFERLRTYLGSDPSEPRIFHLAGFLARLFDDYQVYRCDTLLEWEENDTTPPHPDDAWQAKLWRRLVAEDPNSYASLFARMRSAPPEQVKERFAGTYRQVAVFGITAMPLPYTAFFHDLLGRVTEVTFYLLNPGREYWLEDVSTRKYEISKERLALQDIALDDETAALMLPEKGHELLCSLGGSLQEFLWTVHDRIGGVSSECFSPPNDGTILATLQSEMLACREAAGSLPTAPADDSIRIQICHSPRREVEVLRDHLLKAFSEEGLHPSQLQVLVTDLETYAPHIDAVFGTVEASDPAYIPYAIETRGSEADCDAAKAFRMLARLGDKTARFTVSDILSLLDAEPVREAFGLTLADMEMIEALLEAGGIRWGLTADQRREMIGIEVEPYLTWEHGLDRLLTGYMTGREAEDRGVWQRPAAEGNSAEILGRLHRFVTALKTWRRCLNESQKRLPDKWRRLFDDLADTFLVATETSYRDVAAVRKAIQSLEFLETRPGATPSAPVTPAVVLAFIEERLNTVPNGDSLSGNRVVFCRLRPMNSRPAEWICILGLNDGTFPRSDHRSRADLLARTRRRGDRSLRRDDRTAFLEAVVNARRRLYLSYTGRTDSGNEIVPPSIVLQELRDYLANRFGWEETRQPDGSHLLPIETLHRMYGFAADYFDPNRRPELFSYSNVYLQAARQHAQPHTPPDSRDASAADDIPNELDLDDLDGFLRNPAKTYYRHRLGIDLTPGETAPPEDEPFDLSGGLDRLSLNEELVRLLLDADTGGLPDEHLRRFKADGLLPLDRKGEEDARETATNIRDWLQTPIHVNGSEWKLRDLLARARKTKPTDALLILNTESGHPPLRLTGAIRPLQTESDSLLLFARPTKIKAKDRLRARLHHLFACAALPETHPITLLAGWDRNRRKASQTEIVPTWKSAKAKRRLAELASLCRRGFTECLPFSPETVMAYLEEASKNRGRDPLEEARKRWGTPTSFSYCEARDPWLYRAFGDDGPTAKPDFAEIAETIQRCLFPEDPS